jgi:hypothetical protein
MAAVKPDGDGRLKAHLIPATCLGRANHISLENTLQQVRHLAGQEIKRLRATKDAHSYRDGRKHAFYVQQLANAQLLLGNIGT